MKFKPPFPLSSVVQKFGDNAVPFYQAGLGLKGHPGMDFAIPFGTIIPAVTDSVVGAVLSKDNPNLMSFRAVNTYVDDVDGNSYEIQYGHCSNMYATVGEALQAGVVVGRIGNTGEVYEGGRLITEAEKEAGSRAGSHLHFQVRLLKKEVENAPDVPGAHYLNDGSARLIIAGFKYRVQNWENGYNGCIDSMPFFTILFNSNLYLGQTGLEVSELQRRLGVSPQTGFFGPLTFIKVVAYQKANGITPTGFVGPLTRAKLNQ